MNFRRNTVKPTNAFTAEELMRFIGITCLIAGLMTFSEPVASQDADRMVIPLMQWEAVNTPLFDVSATAAGFAVVNPNSVFTGLYSVQKASASEHSWPERQSELELLLDGQSGRFHYIGLLKGESAERNDLPTAFQGAAVVGFELGASPSWSVTLGGGLAAGDFGLQTKSGINIPVIPVPFIRLQSEQPWLTAQIDLITSPNLTFTAWPSGKIRWHGDMRFDSLRDSRDVISELSLEYRLFPEASSFGDIGGLMLGFKNDAFTVHESAGNNVDLQYQSWFAALDLSLLKFTVGRTVNTRLRHEESIFKSEAAGVFVSVQGMLAF